MLDQVLAALWGIKYPYRLSYSTIWSTIGRFIDEGHHMHFDILLASANNLIDL